MEKLEDMKNIPISIVAEILGKNEQFVRLGLQRNQLNIGTAVLTSTQWSYHVSYNLLKNYVGVERLNDYENKKMTNLPQTEISQ